MHVLLFVIILLLLLYYCKCSNNVEGFELGSNRLNIIDHSDIILQLFSSERIFYINPDNQDELLHCMGDDCSDVYTIEQTGRPGEYEVNFNVNPGNIIKDSSYNTILPTLNLVVDNHPDTEHHLLKQVVDEYERLHGEGHSDYNFSVEYFSMQ